MVGGVTLRLQVVVPNLDTVSQTVTLVVGCTYHLSFILLMDGGTPSQFSVTLNGDPVLDGKWNPFSATNPPVGNSVDVSVFSVGTAVNTLTFGGYDMPGVLAIENVQLLQLCDCGAQPVLDSPPSPTPTVRPRQRN